MNVLELPKTQIKAAAYVRMSTEHQKYSPDNQMAVINEYANKHGYEIIKIYLDEGKSGLNINGRVSLQQMIEDVETHKAKYKAILVLDISRLGRFQNPDQAAHLEYTFNIANIKIIYCAEQFENDGSPISTVIKGIKRSMAAEYSRELSCKVFAGQAKLITLGYRQGGHAGYGLRRMLIDEHGKQQRILFLGQHKSITTDRIILVPGINEEVENVKWMYNAFTYEGKTEREIANILNDKGVMTDLNRLWTPGTIKQVLSNEKYIGNNIYNRISCKLKGRLVKNPTEEWVRKDEIFTPIIDKKLFFKARDIFMARCKKLSNEEMLQKLRELKSEKGYLSAIIINEAENMPSSSAYQGRFGGLIRAYQLIGYDPGRDFEYIEINRRLRSIHENIFKETIQKIRDIGADVEILPNTNLININNMVTASIVICRCTKTSSNTYQWKIRFDNLLKPDITIAARMDSTNKEILDYYVLPALDFKFPHIRLKENNPDLLDSYRFNNLDQLLNIVKVVNLSEVA